MAQSSLWRLWRLGVVEVDAADMVYAADGVARSEVGAAELCSTRRTEAQSAQRTRSRRYGEGRSGRSQRGGVMLDAAD